MPVEKRDTGQVEGPGKTVPVRWLVLGLFWFSQIAATRDLTGELRRRAIGESSVRTTHIVFLPPGVDDLLGLGQRLEPVCVQDSARNVPLKLSTKALSVGFGKMVIRR